MDKCGKFRERKHVMEMSDVKNNAMSLLFEYSFRKEEDPEAIYKLYLEMNGLPDSKRLHEYYGETLTNLEFIDGEIRKYAVGWSLERISPLALAVLRLSIFEMYFREKVPDLVSISDALRIMDSYDGDVKRKKFVNGILNSVYNARKEAGENVDGKKEKKEEK